MKRLLSVIMLLAAGLHATLAVAGEYFDQRVKDGFAAVHFHAVSKEAGPVKNVNGDEPFAPPDDILKPNEACWRHLDAVLAAAEKRGLAVAISALWNRRGGDDKQGWRAQLTDANEEEKETSACQRIVRINMRP